MSETEKRRKDRQELHDMLRLIEPAKNEDIARKAVGIADYWLIKAENQAKHIRDLEARNSKQSTIEPKKGRWIEYDNSHCECPFCHEEWSYFDNEVERFNFCPNCGTKMEEGADE